MRSWWAPLLATPLHPQWLVARRHRHRTDWVAQRAVGGVLGVGWAGSALHPGAWLLPTHRWMSGGYYVEAVRA